MNQKRLLLFAFCLTLIFSCKVKKEMTAPFTDIYFKKDNWLMVYCEYKQEGPYKDFETKNYWILTDNQLLDSLKGEFRCFPDGQSDCMNCSIIELYKDHKHFAEYTYTIDQYFTFGKLKNHLYAADANELYCKNVDVAKMKRDSLNRLNIPNTCFTDMDQPYQCTYTIELSLDNVNDTDFATRREKTQWQNSYEFNAKKELLRLYPDLNADNVSVFGFGRFYNLRVNCNKDFTLDTDKLKNNPILRYYHVTGLEEINYYITYYLKR